MFKLLKIKADKRFKQSPPSVQGFAKNQTQKDKRKFFYHVIAHQLQEPSLIIQFIVALRQKELFLQKDFASVIWSLSLQLASFPKMHKHLSNLVKLIADGSLIDKSFLLQNLTDLLISQSGLMEQQQIDKKISRAYTKNNFQQHKHSLYRESNEGFSKLLLLLVNLNDSHHVEEAWSKVLSLIGNFDLDPDRVLDIIVQTKLMNSKENIYLCFIQKFKRESIAIILGNKLAKINKEKAKSLIFGGYVQSFMKTNLTQIYNKEGLIPNPALISLICQMIRKKIIYFQDIQNFLQPSDIDLQEINYKRIKFAEQKVMKSFKISLEELDKQEKIDIFHEDNLKAMGQLLCSSKLALISEFAHINEWSVFKKLWTKYAQKKLDILLYQPLMNNLFRLAQWMIEPIYEKISFARLMKRKNNKSQNSSFVNQNGLKQIEQLNQSNLQDLLDILSFFKDYIGFKHSLFVKICRIFKHLLKHKSQSVIKFSTLTFQYIQQRIKQVTLHYLVPGINYEINNPTLGTQAFGLLELLPYQFRYQTYLQVYQNYMTHNPYIAKTFQIVKNKQNVIVNNLSKDNKKQFGKRLAKLTHNHALQVLYWIVRRLLKEDYQAVVPEIIGALNNATPLTLQMTMFLMIFYLNEHKQPAVKIKTAQLQPWFKNIITFVSLFYRKYLEVDMTPLLDFIIVKTSEEIRQLQDNEQMPGSYLKLLHELLNKMLGSFIEEDITKTKFEMLCTGPRLQFQLRYLTSEIRAAKKSKHTLQEFFWDKTVNHFENNTMAFNLLILLCQKRAEFMHKTMIQNLKILGDAYDDFTVLIVQLMKVLAYQASYSKKYAQLLSTENPLDLLINNYKIPIEIAFQIVRPGVQHVSKMNQQEFTIIKNKVDTAFTNFVSNNDYLYQGYADQNIKQFFIQSKGQLKKYLPISFFTSFWFLTLDSVYFPEKLYAEKIVDLGKKLEGVNSSRKAYDRQTDKTKALYEKIQKQQEQQKQKTNSTLTPENLKRLQVSILKNANQAHLLVPFAQSFVKICLLPRLLLDPREALYCMKFTILMIKANKMSSSKSIRLLTYIIEFVMNYLPYATKRQASNCLATFLSQILGIFINWNDAKKLKQDMKKYLDIEDLKDNYQKLRQYLLKIFERVGNLIKSIVEQPYIIKNCLYLLEKVDSIPGYKQQAQELEDHMKELKEKYQTVDMKTILDMQLILLNFKKEKLTEKPLDKNSLSLSNSNKETPQKPKGTQSQAKKDKSQEKKTPIQTMPAVYSMMGQNNNSQRRDLSKDRQYQRVSKDRDRYSKDRQDRYSKDRNQRGKDRNSKDRERQKQKQKQRDKNSKEFDKNARDRSKDKYQRESQQRQQKDAKYSQDRYQKNVYDRDSKYSKDREKDRNSSKVNQSRKLQKQASVSKENGSTRDSKIKEDSRKDRLNENPINRDHIDHRHTAVRDAQKFLQANAKDSKQQKKKNLEQIPVIQKRMIKGQQIKQTNSSLQKNDKQAENLGNKSLKIKQQQKLEPTLSKVPSIKPLQQQQSVGDAIPPMKSFKTVREETHKRIQQQNLSNPSTLSTIQQIQRSHQLKKEQQARANLQKDKKEYPPAPKVSQLSQRPKQLGESSQKLKKLQPPVKQAAKQATQEVSIGPSKAQTENKVTLQQSKPKQKIKIIQEDNRKISSNQSKSEKQNSKQRGNHNQNDNKDNFPKERTQSRKPQTQDPIMKRENSNNQRLQPNKISSTQIQPINKAESSKQTEKKDSKRDYQPQTKELSSQRQNSHYDKRQEKYRKEDNRQSYNKDSREDGRRNNKNQAKYRREEMDDQNRYRQNKDNYRETSKDRQYGDSKRQKEGRDSRDYSRDQKDRQRDKARDRDRDRDRESKDKYNERDGRGKNDNKDYKRRDRSRDRDRHSKY